ncbi:MAG: hypothetical protein Edafosvirus41_3 [Edafosvirus sp.]|uniref:EF-1-gamma C-terminal domain-containing protein n=1 Tax=Edafosvirus sp. TaxID=2487765 RepID=A0A3G4ZVE4_9VIRU|nr:MAG: hypothetical protein Edafosvirus41_3 [Edafosvirus sp.]
MTDNDIDADVVEVKVKNPLDGLPKSPMILDTCKKLFFDHKKLDTLNTFFDEFIKNFDSVGYSIYTANFKYNDDFSGRPSFVNNNSINGYIQNLDTAHKYAFGSFVLLKNDESTYELKSLWILRGDQPIKEVMKDFIDYNDWTKINPHKITNELNDYFNASHIDGKEVTIRAIYV